MRKKSTRAVSIMAWANFETWLRSPRTILMALFTLAICYIESSMYGKTFQSFGHIPHWDELFFYAFVDGCNMRTTSVLFLITMSELPRKMAYQYQHLIRTHRIAWIKAQLLYCFWAVLMMQLAMAFCMGIFSIPYAASGFGWTEPQLVANGLLLEEECAIPLAVSTSMSTLTANLLAQIPIFCFRLIMVSVILLMSLYGQGVLGVLIYAFILMANRTILVEAFYGIVLPTHFATLGGIVSTFEAHEWFLGTSQTVLVFITTGGYCIVMSILYCLMVQRGKKCDLTF
ncbi:MAG: hypothetical protein RR085_10870 [Clostridia bacterium]